MFSSHPGLLAACRAEVVVPIAFAAEQVPFRSLSGSLLRTWALSQNKTPTYSLGDVSESSLRHQRIACPAPCDGAA
jgi:hypothetical protein